MTETKDDVAALVAELNKQSRLIYLATDESVAKHMSAIFVRAAIALSTSEARTAQAVAAAYEDAARVAEYHGDTWSGTRCVETCLQESAVDEKVVEIAAAIRARATTAGER